MLACGGSEKKVESTEQTTALEQNIAFVAAEDKASLAKYYSLEHIKEWYPERVLPPVFDFNVDLSDKTIVELALLRNEIFARNGYLFEDAMLRGYFNQFKWYQPIFDVPEFKVELNKQEQEFVSKVLAMENQLAGQRYMKQGEFEVINMDHVHNLQQFKGIDEELKRTLAKINFSIVPASHAQLFHVYDHNHYQYVPNFITTDLYLQVLHKHLSSILRTTEEEKLIPLVTELVGGLVTQVIAFRNKATDPKLQSAAQWSASYLSIAYDLIAGATPDASFSAESKEEVEKILHATGVGSAFLDFRYLQYSQFTPRGNYTKSRELEKYFRCIKWLNSAPIMIDTDERFLSALVIAAFIRNTPAVRSSFNRFNEAIRFIAGEEDNASIAGLVNLLTPEQAANPAILNNPATLAELRKKLQAVSHNKIKPKAADAKTTESLDRPSVFFTAGRYTFDAEILSRLVHVLSPNPKRPFPKGLDVFAALGSSHAKKILLEELKEQRSWPQYPDSLQTITREFSDFDDWNQTIYNKTFDAVNALNVRGEREPRFMKTDAWRKKSLSTSLAAWAELKHDMLLYAEQPWAAQAGQGGGPPPPIHLSYVEPNVAFWEKCLELLALQEETLTRMELMTDKIKQNSEKLRGLASMLLKISQKELANELISEEEFHELSYIGGRVEYLTFDILDSDHLPEQEKEVAVVADVYNNNGVFLEEAVGMVDEIYVVAEINGKPFLTKGAVFSYFEFTSDQPLTDEAWRTRLSDGQQPERPAWMKEIVTKASSLESKPSYSF